MLRYQTISVSEWGKLLSCVRLFVTPWTVAHQAPPSMGLSRQEYWSGVPFPSPGDLPDPGIEPRSPILQADALTSEPLVIFFCPMFSKYFTTNIGDNINTVICKGGSLYCSKLHVKLRDVKLCLISSKLNFFQKPLIDTFVIMYASSSKMDRCESFLGLN